jgi:hypothetical protein
VKTRSRHTTWGLAAIVATILLVGCGPSAPAPTSGGVEFQEYAQQNIDEARANGASDEQLMMLERAKETGSVPLEDARSAARSAVECMENSGVVAEYTEETTNAGLVLPNYRAQISDDEPALEGLIEQCDAQEYLWVGKLYALQPSSRDATDAYVEERLPYLRACLDEHGVDVDDSATRAELFQAASQLLDDTAWGTNCFAEAGIDRD